MDYGPNWPPRPPAPRRRDRTRMDPTFTMLVAGLMMLGFLALWQSMAPVRMDFPRQAPTPVAGGGHASHRPGR